MKKIVQLIGSLIAGTGVIASSSYFEGCTDYYGPPPYSDYDEALEKCRGIFEQAIRVENFGNGRYVRNVLEQAIMRQSNRLVTSASASGKVTDLSKETMCRLEAGDFNMVPLGNKGGTRIGFAV